MAEACNLSSISRCPNDTHGNDCCPHDVRGPAVTCSPNVKIGGEGALRVGDTGTHSTCCGSNTWEAIEGSSKVFINGKPAVRKGDKTRHCGGDGEMITGVATVNIG